MGLWSELTRRRDDMSERLLFLGIAMVVIGVVVLIVAALADLSDSFRVFAVSWTIVGAVAAVGAYLYRRVGER